MSKMQKHLIICKRQDTRPSSVLDNNQSNYKTIQARLEASGINYGKAHNIAQVGRPFHAINLSASASLLYQMTLPTYMMYE
eukprot:scaffold148569_cov21-Prasinocladus_malaysianus.AAC.1